MLATGMNVLFSHQNFPGQYLHLAGHLARNGHTVVALSSRPGVSLPDVKIFNYEVPQERASGTHRYLVKSEEAVIRGERVANLALNLSISGFKPDIICAHPGWGEALYLRDVWKDVPQLHYCEFYFAPFKGTHSFRSREPVHVDQIFELETRNALALVALNSCDAGVTPTHWQYEQYPSVYQPRISVVHEGINVNAARPNPDAVIVLPSGRRLTRAQRIVTYVSRNLEPTRGFPEFMRAAALLLQQRADVEIIIIGGDDVSYGPPPPSGQCWRQLMLAELDIDLQRVHFLGKVPYPVYLSALQISSAHIYLTAPFVASWSMFEAMAAGCLVIGSDTPPVREVIEDGRNGMLVDFFDRDGLVRRIEEALSGGPSIESMREAARRTILDRYSLAQCLPEQVALIKRTAQPP